MTLYEIKVWYLFYLLGKRSRINVLSAFINQSISFSGFKLVMTRRKVFRKFRQLTLPIPGAK
jgi:hypothetical protein